MNGYSIEELNSAIFILPGSRFFPFRIDLIWKSFFVREANKKSQIESMIDL